MPGDRWVVLRGWWPRSGLWGRTAPSDPKVASNPGVHPLIRTRNLANILLNHISEHISNSSVMENPSTPGEAGWFNLMEAMNVWPRSHRKAFLRWASDPRWP